MAGRAAREVIWDKRREWIRKHREIGLSVAQFCRDHGLNLGNFHAWRLPIAEPYAKPCDSSAEVCLECGGGPYARSNFVQLAIPANSRPATSPPWVTTNPRQIPNRDGRISESSWQTAASNSSLKSKLYIASMSARRTSNSLDNLSTKPLYSDIVLTRKHCESLFQANSKHQTKLSFGTNHMKRFLICREVLNLRSSTQTLLWLPNSHHSN